MLTRFCEPIPVQFAENNRITMLSARPLWLAPRTPGAKNRVR